MGVEVLIFEIIARSEHGLRRSNLRSRGIRVPASAHFFLQRIGGILRCCPIKNSLTVVKIGPLLGRGEKPEIDAQLLIERALTQVDFRHKIVATVVFHHHFAFTIGHRRTIVGRFRAAVEGNVVTV